MAVAASCHRFAKFGNTLLVTTNTVSWLTGHDREQLVGKNVPYATMTRLTPNSKEQIRDALFGIGTPVR